LISVNMSPKLQGGGRCISGESFATLHR